MLGWAWLEGAGVQVIGRTIAIGVRPASRTGAALYRAAAILGRPPFIGAIIFAIAHAVVITVGAAPRLGHARLVGAHVLGIGKPIPITVPIRWSGAAVIGGARLIRANVLPVGRAIAVAIGAAIGCW